MKNTMKDFDLTYIKINDDPDCFNRKDNITPHIEDIIESIFDDLINERKSVEKKLLKYIVKYPEVPVFANYLTAYYIEMGRYEEAYECNRNLLKEHPHHFYGIINLGYELLRKGNYEGLGNLVGENFNLHEAMPYRENFHPDEIVSFYTIVLGYLFATDRFEEAGLIEEKLHEFDPENPKLDRIEPMKWEFVIKTNFARMKEEGELSQTVETVPTKTTKYAKAPTFHNQEFMDMLYSLEISDYPQILQELPNVEAKTLPLDLETCIEDSIKRYGYFQDGDAKEELGEAELQFPIHAFVLMADFETPNALESIFSFLRQDHDFIEFWLSDLIQDILGPPLMKYGKEDLKACFDFMCEPNIYAYNKAVISEAIVPLAILKLEKRSEIIEHARSLLNFYAINFEDPKIGDTEFLGFFVSYLMDIKAVELIDEITLLFQKGYVSSWICGTLKDVMTDIYSESETSTHLEIFETAEAHYEHLDQYWVDGDDSDDWEDDDYGWGKSDTENTFVTKPIKAGSKVGRNEPCPCGSGKKYKKCCINK